MSDIASFFPMLDIPPESTSTLLKGGTNNRVFRIDIPSGERLILKQYFQHPSDPRQRLATEFTFLTYAWNSHIRTIPEPLACHTESNIGLYTFVPGKPFSPQDISAQNIQAACDFLLALNNDRPSAHHLPVASDPCFSTALYYRSVENRLQRFSEHPNIGSWIAHHLLPEWKKIKISSQELSPEERCISPSDFGFHNALIHDKDVFFLDFEYGGWDDPAKAAADFICQPKTPIPSSYFNLILQKLSSLARDKEAFYTRVQTLLPLAKIKWCCILLNSSLREEKKRRAFAGAHFDEKALITQAETYLRSLPWHI